MLFHSEDISFGQYFHDVFGGVSYWFTSTLAVSQIISIAMLFSNCKNIFFYVATSVVIFLTGCLLKSIDPTPFPWYYKSGMGATLYMTLGGIYQKYEKEIDKSVGRYGFIIICLIYICVICLDFNQHNALSTIMGMKVNLFGMLVTFLGIGFIVGIAKVLPKSRWLNYIGRNSIIFYFFSGVNTAVFGTLLQRIFPNKFYVITLAVVFVSVLLSTIITCIVNRYLPFLLDIRKLSIKLNGKKN
jgi:hypothetical protein